MMKVVPETFNPSPLVRVAEWLDVYRKSRIDVPHSDSDGGHARQMFHEDLIVTAEFLRQVAGDINEHAGSGMRN